MPANQSRSKLLVPALLALLFVGPFATAIFLYFYGGDSWRPQGSVAHGVLLENPRSLGNEPVRLPDGGEASFVRKWSLLYVGSGQCDANCQQALYEVRQVRQALGKEMSRVQRFFISTSSTPDAEFLRSTHPDLIVIDSSVAASGRVLATLGEFSEADVFVVDPLGNIMLRFPAGTAMKDMHKDLSLLLKASTIG